MPTNRVVCDTPIVAGRVNNTDCGFIVFMENGELMLECYGFGSQSLPKNIRDLNVAVSTNLTATNDAQPQRTTLGRANPKPSALR